MRQKHTLHTLNIAFFTGIVYLISAAAQALPPVIPDRGLAKTHQALLALKNPRCVMCLAAHPDDEDSTTLAYLEKHLGVKTVLVTFTRGEGGQNEIGPELGNQLAVIRAAEMQAMAEIVGCRLENLCAPEFGFSKTAKETLAVWDREELVRRLVILIRTYQPDVIITHHDTVSGHGHHQATAIIGLEAFEKAGDANAFADAIPSVLQPWQPAAFYMRVFDDPPGEGPIIDIPVGTLDPIRGQCYSEMGAAALKQHASQGRWNQVDTIGKEPRSIRYQRVRALFQKNIGNSDLFDGLEETIDARHPARVEFTKQINERLREWEYRLLDDPYLLFTRIKDVSPLIKALPKEEWPFIHRKLTEWEHLMACVTGLEFKLIPQDRIVTPDQTFAVEWKLYNPRGLPLDRIVLQPVSFGFQQVRQDDSVPLELSELGERAVQTGTMYFQWSRDTLPPWAPPASASFMWIDSPTATAAIDRPAEDRLNKLVHSREFGKPNCKVNLILTSGDVQFTLHSETSIRVEPNLELRCIPQHAMVIRNSTQPLTIRCEAINHQPESNTLRIQPAAIKDWRWEPAYHEISLPGEESVDAVSFQFTPLAEHPESIVLKAIDTSHAMEVSDFVTPVVLDVRTASNLLVGIVQSYDDTLVSALSTLGVSYELLDRDTLLRGELDRYDTILVDIRAYLVREDLRRGNQRLLDYVHRGGTAVVFYQKVFEWNQENGNPGWAPYPLRISHDRITVEESPVTLLQPDYPLLSWPNRLGPEDWTDWVQERGLYFAAEYAPDYTELIECADPDEPPLRSGYLAARYGKGWYVYTALVWYRQLRAGVPGAYRVLANMVSLPDAPQ